MLGDRPARCGHGVGGCPHLAWHPVAERAEQPTDLLDGQVDRPAVSADAAYREEPGCCKYRTRDAANSPNSGIMRPQFRIVHVTHFNAATGARAEILHDTP